MSRKKKQLTDLFLTERAVADLLLIDSYSIEQWGKRPAAKYMADIESCLQLIQENSGLLSPFEGLPGSLQFYTLRKHVLICDVRPKSLVVLTVIHGSIDIPNRLAELVPTLSAEVAMLHERLKTSRKR